MDGSSGVASAETAGPAAPGRSHVVPACPGDDAAALACVLRSRVQDDPLFGYDAATMARAERAARRERLGQ